MEESQSDVKFFEVKIDSSSLRVFSAALHLCQKVGKDLIIEVEEHAMALRALNDNKSAYISIEFSADYFDNYNLYGDSAFACKLAVKPICLIMRNLKPVKSIVLSASRLDAVHELAFRLTQFNGITRSTRFYYSDCEVMNAVFNDEECSMVNMSPKLLAHVLQNMHRSSEVSFQATPNSTAIKSHFLPEVWLQDYRVIMNTGMTISVDEFDVYEFRSDSNKEELVFCAKDVNAFLAFCEALEMSSFDFLFSSGGRAIKFHSKQDLVAVSLIMATIQPHPSPQQHGEETTTTRGVVSHSPNASNVNKQQNPKRIHSSSEHPQTNPASHQLSAESPLSQRTEKSPLNSQNVLEASLVLGSIRQLRTEDILFSSGTSATSIDVPHHYKGMESDDDETIDERTLNRERQLESDPEFDDNENADEQERVQEFATHEMNLTATSNENPKPVIKRAIGNQRKRSFLEDSDTDDD